MAGFSGKSGSAAIGSIVLLEATWNLDNQTEAIEITNFASAGLKEIVAGIESWTVDVSGFIDGSTNPTKPTGSTTIELKDGNNTITGSGIVTSFKRIVDARGAVSFDVTLEGSGALTGA